jgi:hypothetical protein
MKTMHWIGATALLGSVVIAGVTALMNSQGQQRDGQLPPAIPAEPHKQPVGVVYAQRFEVREPFTHYYRADKPQVKSGWLLVLSASPDLLYRRETYEPVLYVGAQTAERVNTGYESGRLVAIVPGDFLLEDAPIFFGSPSLPEATGGMDIDRELKLARDAGVRPPTADHLATVVKADVLRVQGSYELRMKAVDLVAQFSPQEKDFIAGERVPRVQ